MKGTANSSLAIPGSGNQVQRCASCRGLIKSRSVNFLCALRKEPSEGRTRRTFIIAASAGQEKYGWALKEHKAIPGSDPKELLVLLKAKCSKLEYSGS